MINIVQNGTNLVVKTINRQVVDIAKTLPGRKRWKNGELWVEGSGPNIETLLSSFPAMAEMSIPAINEFLGAREREADVLVRKSLPPEAASFPFKTKPFEHQLKAFALSRHAEYFGLFMEMGCIDGDAEVVLAKGSLSPRSHQRISMRKLYEMWTRAHGSNPHHSSKPTTWNIKCLAGDKFAYQEIENVTCSGLRSVLKITLEDGKTLRCTPLHLIATENHGWVNATRLTTEMSVVVNGRPAPYDRSKENNHQWNGGIKWEGPYKMVYRPEHPRANNGRYVYEHILVMEEKLGVPIPKDPNWHIHHIDGNPSNNHPDNLELISAKEHLEKHGISDIKKLDGAKTPNGGTIVLLPRYSRVVSVEPDGEAEVYDIEMKGEYKNFVANRMVVHNTGKTHILINNAFALYAEGHLDRVIVVTINGVHRQWVDQQIPEHAPDFPWEARAYSSGMGVKAVRDMEAAAQDFSKLQFMTMAFESLASKRAQEMFVAWARSGRVMIILDESQKIKNPGAARTKFLLKQAEFNMAQKGYRRIATGTEVTQGLEDLYTQLKFLHPQVLGHNSFYSFRNEYCRLAPIPGAPVGAYRIVGYQNVDRLRQRIDGCTFRVMKKDCLDLPEKVYVQRFVGLTPEQSKAYQSLKKYMVAQIGEDTVIEAPLAITLLMKLQQVVSGQLIDEEGVTHEMPTERLGAVLDILEERKASGLEAKAIVWARFRADIERLEKTLTAEGYSVGTYFGDTNQEERERIIKPGAVDILIANPASAGAGLNLTHFDLAIYYSNSFNAADRWQSEDRIHRIGQKNCCTYVDLVAIGTVDSKLVESLSRKKEVAESIRTPQDILLEEVAM